METNNPNSRIDVEPSLIRLNYLIQEGFTRTEIENMAGINRHTLRAILRKKTKKITQATHDKIKSLHSNYIIHKTDDVIKIKDKEFEEILHIQNMKSYLWIVIGFVIISVIILMSAIKYIFSL